MSSTEPVRSTQDDVAYAFFKLIADKVEFTTHGDDWTSGTAEQRAQVSARRFRDAFGFVLMNCDIEAWADRYIREEVESEHGRCRLSR